MFMHSLTVLLKSNGSKIVLKVRNDIIHSYRTPYISFPMTSSLQLHGFQHAKILAEHDTFGAGITVAPTNPGLWLGPEVRNTQP